MPLRPNSSENQPNRQRTDRRLRINQQPRQNVVWGWPDQAERRSRGIANQYSVAELAPAELAQSCLDSLCQVQEITARALACQWHTETASLPQQLQIKRRPRQSVVFSAEPFGDAPAVWRRQLHFYLGRRTKPVCRFAREYSVDANIVDA